MEVAADAEENLPVVSSDDEADLLECEEPSLAAVVAASARIGDKRRPLNCVSRLEFLTDLVRSKSARASLPSLSLSARRLVDLTVSLPQIAFLKENGDGDLVTPAGALLERATPAFVSLPLTPGPARSRRQPAALPREEAEPEAAGPPFAVQAGAQRRSAVGFLLSPQRLLSPLGHRTRRLLRALRQPPPVQLER